DQASQHAANDVALGHDRLDRFPREQVYSMREHQVGFQLLDGALRNPQELDIGSAAVAPIAFSNIGWHRSSSPAILGSEAVDFASRQLRGQPASRLGKVHSLIPDAQVTIRLYRDRRARFGTIDRLPTANCRLPHHQLSATLAALSGRSSPKQR